MDEETHNKPNLPLREKKSCCNTGLVVSCKVIIILVAIFGVFVGGIEYQKYKFHKAQLTGSRAVVDSVSTAGRYSKLTASTAFEMDSLDLRLHPKSNCEAGSCFRCKTEIPARTRHEPVACDPDPRVYNGSCFLCRGECWTLHDLLRALSTGFRCSRRSEHVSCCLIAQMANLSPDPRDKCGTDGEYKCYSDHVHRHAGRHSSQPICECPPERRGDGCLEESLESLSCRCYRGGYRFCGEETMIHCDDTTSDWSQCHKYIENVGERLHCVCDKVIEGDIDVNALVSCSDPDL